MWLYHQSSGILEDASGAVICTGYSGNGLDMNNPDSQSRHMHGPIPQGVWHIIGFFNDYSGKGPLVSHLAPDPMTETFGRDGFMIHGDNQAMDHSASDGCIILPHYARLTIARSEDKKILVNI